MDPEILAAYPELEETWKDKGTLIACALCGLSILMFDEDMDVLIYSHFCGEDSK